MDHLDPETKNLLSSTDPELDSVDSLDVRRDRPQEKEIQSRRPSGLTGGRRKNFEFLGEQQVFEPVTTQVTVQSHLQESISRQIQASKQELEHLRTKIEYQQNELEKEVENSRIAEDEEFQIKSIVQGLENRNNALQQDICEVLESRREVDIELEALKGEIAKIRVGEGSRIMSMGQECFDSFLQQFKKTTDISNNMNESLSTSENSPMLKESSDIINKEIDELEAELSKEYSELRQQILKVEEHIKSVKDKIGQVKVSPSKEGRQVKVKKLQRDKIDLSGQVVRLEQEYETLKLRTGRNCKLLMKK